MAVNCSKGLYEGCKWLKMAGEFFFKWLETAEDGSETDGNG